MTSGLKRDLDIAASISTITQFSRTKSLQKKNTGIKSVLYWLSFLQNICFAPAKKWLRSGGWNFFIFRIDSKGFRFRFYPWRIGWESNENLGGSRHSE